MLSAVGVDLATERAVRFTFSVEGNARGVRPFAADEAFLIGREALINAFRHGEATTVELRIRYTSDQLALSVRDNGRGIRPEVLARGYSPGHWGLRGMQEGAERIRARLQIGCEPGRGTEIELRIDADVAYGSRVPARPTKNKCAVSRMRIWSRSSRASSKPTPVASDAHSEQAVSEFSSSPEA